MELLDQQCKLQELVAGRDVCGLIYGYAKVAYIMHAKAQLLCECATLVKKNTRSAGVQLHRSDGSSLFTPREVTAAIVILMPGDDPHAGD